MIRIAVLDRRPAVRAGIEATLHAAPGLVSAGAAAGRHDLWPLIHRTRPDVVVLEHEPGACDALGLCLRVKARIPAPRVVLVAAAADDRLVVPATFAGADAVVDSAADLRELLHAIRVVAGGGRVMPAITPRLQTQAAARLAPRDRAIFAMRLAGTPAAEIAATVGLTPRRLAGRVQAIVAALGAGAPAYDGAPDLAVRALGAAA
jgi:DNA-binding NarL/FixJ family response regulator